MGTRAELQSLLVGVLGTTNVYFQPPPTIKMVYPCIIYTRENAVTTFSNNKPYNNKKQYLVTVIDKDPDSKIPDKVAQLPLCVFDRFYTADNLNHDVFKLFF